MTLGRSIFCALARTSCEIGRVRASEIGQVTPAEYGARQGQKKYYARLPGAFLTWLVTFLAIFLLTLPLAPIGLAYGTLAFRPFFLALRRL